MSPPPPEAAPRAPTPAPVAAEIIDTRTLPDELAAERGLTPRSVMLSIEQIVMVDPAAALQKLDALQKVIGGLRSASLALTTPNDWTVSRAKDGRVIATLRKSGAERVAVLWGVSVIPRGPVTVTKTPEDKTVAEVVVDVYSRITHDRVDGVRGYRVLGEEFTGRSRTLVGLEDLKQAAQTAAFTKGVRVLAGLSAISPADLARAWNMPVEQAIGECHQGHGFGTSTERSMGGRAGEEEKREARTNAGTSSAGGSSARAGVISEPQARRLWAKACARGEQVGIKPQAILKTVLPKHGVPVTGELKAALAAVPLAKYDAACADVDTFTPEPPADEGDQRQPGED